MNPFDGIDLSQVDDAFISDYLNNHSTDFGSIINPLKKGLSVYRCRPITSVNPKHLLHHVKQISYRRDTENIRTHGRCNLPYQSVFYGSINSNSLDCGYFTCISETSKLIRKGIGRFNGIQLYQVGRWDLICDLEVAAIIPNQKHSTLDTEYKKFYDLYKNQNSTNSRDSSVLSLADEYMKVVLPNQEYQYRVSAVYSNSILNSNKVQGLIYPSVQSEYKGVNLVMKPTVVDLCTHFKASAIYAVITIENVGKIFPVYQSDVVGNDIKNWRLIDKYSSVFEIIEEIEQHFYLFGINRRRIIEMFENQFSNHNEPYLSKVS